MEDERLVEHENAMSIFWPFSTDDLTADIHMKEWELTE